MPVTLARGIWLPLRDSVDAALTYPLHSYFKNKSKIFMHKNAPPSLGCVLCLLHVGGYFFVAKKFSGIGEKG